MLENNGLELDEDTPEEVVEIAMQLSKVKQTQFDIRAELTKAKIEFCKRSVLKDFVSRHFGIAL